MLMNIFRWRALCVFINSPMIFAAIAYVLYKIMFDDPMLKNVRSSVIYAAELLGITAITQVINIVMWLRSRGEHSRSNFIKKIALTSLVIVAAAI